MNRTKENTINLENYRAKDSKVFTGRDRGLDIRKRSKIDDMEIKFDEIYFVVPDNVYAINPSFFEELLENVVLKLGKEKFLNKFHFIYEGSFNFDNSLDEAINRILRKTTALD